VRAVRIESIGGPEVLQVVDTQFPRPAPDEVLIRNHAMGVGRPDILVRTGRYAWMPRLPAIIGIESAGVVVEVGRHVHTRSVGDAVYVNARDLPERSGGYAEYRTAPARAAHLLPQDCDFAQAAALGNYQVAECLLRMGGGFPSVRRVAVFGAAGGVGTALLQLARVRGLYSIAVVSSSSAGDFVREHGASDVIDRNDGNVAARISDLTSEQGVDLLLDIASGNVLPGLFRALAPMGVIVSYGFLEGEPSTATVAAMRSRFGASPGWRLFSMHALDRLPELRADVTATVIDAFARGRIQPVIHKRMPLSQARDAHELFERGGLRGKLILCPD